MDRHFIAAASKEFVRAYSVMSKETVNSVRVLIARTVVMKRERAVEITSQEK